MFALTELLARAAHVLMFLMGFRPGQQGRFTYWHAPPLAGKAAAFAEAQLPLSQPLSPAPRRGVATLRRHSTSEVVAEAVHHAAEHALDATLAVTSTAAAVVAAQHPHGLATPLSPRTLPPSAAHRSASPGLLRSPGMAAVSAERAASSPPGLVLPEAAVAADGLGGAAAGSSLRRRAKNDSAADYALVDHAAAAAEAENERVEPATESAAAEADAEVRLAASPFRLPALEVPRASPADSAGSVGGGSVGVPAARGAGGTRPDVPVVFLHGVGFGVLPYLHLVRDIQQACSSTPVLMVEVRGGGGGLLGADWVVRMGLELGGWVAVGCRWWGAGGVVGWLVGWLLGLGEVGVVGGGHRDASVWHALRRAARLARTKGQR